MQCLKAPTKYLKKKKLSRPTVEMGSTHIYFFLPNINIFFLHTFLYTVAFQLKYALFYQ